MSFTDTVLLHILDAGGVSLAASIRSSNHHRFVVFPKALVDHFLQIDFPWSFIFPSTQRVRQHTPGNHPRRYFWPNPCIAGIYTYIHTYIVHTINWFDSAATLNTICTEPEVPERRNWFALRNRLVQTGLSKISETKIFSWLKIIFQQNTPLLFFIRKCNNFIISQSLTLYRDTRTNNARILLATEGVQGKW